MKKLLVAIILSLASMPAWAESSTEICNEYLTPEPIAQIREFERRLSYFSFQTSLEEIFHQAQKGEEVLWALAYLNRMGLQEFTEPILEVAKIHHKRRLFPWQKSVSWKFTWTGKLKIYLRPVKWKSSEDVQRTIWDLTNNLYQIHVHRSLWPWRQLRNSVSQRSDSYTPPLLNSLDSDQAMEYFLLQLPVEWRDQWLRSLSQHEHAVYQVFNSLPALDKGNALPERTKSSGYLYELLFGSWTVNPSRAGLAISENSGWLGIEQAHRNRFNRRAVVSWYLMQVKRILLAALIIDAAPSAAVAISEIPNAVEAVGAWVELAGNVGQVVEKAQKNAATNFQTHLQRITREEAGRLVKAIKEAQVSGHLEMAEKLQLELQAHIDKYPWAAYDEINQ